MNSTDEQYPNIKLQKIKGSYHVKHTKNGGKLLYCTMCEWIFIQVTESIDGK